MSRAWDTARRSREARLVRARAIAPERWVEAARVPALLEAILEPGDRVCLEGNNQKQADFLARALARVDPARVRDLHLVLSVLALPEHVELFERGIARRLDFSFSGPQAVRLAQLVHAGRIEIGAIHTYLELYARYFVDLTPRVALVAAIAADREGNLYTGPNTEDTPAIVEATAFRDGLVVAQVNERVDAVPRVDVPAGWVDFLTVAPTPSTIEPLFTRDPALVGEVQVLMAMMVLKGIYAEYGVDRLNHGIGFDSAAIELLLPTYAEALGLRGKICRHWALNPHPTLIPAIEAGFVESVHAFGSELGMERYVAARPDVFFTGRDGSLRSNRAFSQTAGHYACDLFIGSTLQMDLAGNSSTATTSRITGFGGAPNMGADARGRRHASPAWLKAGREAQADPRAMPRGPQARRAAPRDVPGAHGAGVRRAARRLGPRRRDEDGAPAGHDLRGRRHPRRHRGGDREPAPLPDARRSGRRRSAASRATPRSAGRARAPRSRTCATAGSSERPDDLGIDVRLATRDLLAARSVKDLVRWSGGLYDPPARFRSW